MLNKFFEITLVIAAFLVMLMMLNACTANPYPGGQYPAQSPADQMMDAGRTLIYAGKGR